MHNEPAGLRKIFKIRENLWATLNLRSSEHRAKFTSALSRFPRFTRLPVAFRDENHGLKGHNLEP